MPGLTSAPTLTRLPVEATKTPPPTAAPPSPTAVSRKGGEFREVVASDAKSFHVYQTTDLTSQSYQEKVYARGLWRPDPKTLQPIPNMAESWTIAGDGKTYTFKLRKDLKWSDGTPLTAHDFQWTFEQASQPANRYPYIESLKDIVSYQAKDDYTLEVVLKEFTCVGLSIADAVTPLPKHVWEKLDWSDPTRNPEILHPSVVSGLYKLKEWQRDDHATFVRNDLFFRGAPNFDSYTVRIVPNPSAQFQMLKAGEVDLAAVSVSNYAEAKKIDLLKEYNWEPAAAAWTYMGVNLRRLFLQDVEVRHALAYAIPRQTIADKVFLGLAKPAYSYYAPISWAYNPDVPRYDYSIETAQATLAKAGYKTDANGKLLDKGGKPAPKLKILFNTGNQLREQIAVMAQTEFKKLGIESDVIGMEFQAYLDYIKKPPFDYDLYVLGWQMALDTSLDPHFWYQVWNESGIPDSNLGAYVNPKVEELYAQANRPPCSADARKPVYQQIQQIIAADSPYIFLAFRTGYAFLNQRVVPNEPTRLGISYLPELWYIKDK